MHPSFERQACDSARQNPEETVPVLVMGENSVGREDGFTKKSELVQNGCGSTRQIRVEALVQTEPLAFYLYKFFCVDSSCSSVASFLSSLLSSCTHARPVGYTNSSQPCAPARYEFGGKRASTVPKNDHYERCSRGNTARALKQGFARPLRRVSSSPPVGILGKFVFKI